MRATGMSVLRLRASRSCEREGERAPGFEAIGDAALLMLFTLAQERKGGDVGWKELGTPEVTLHLRQQELVRLADGLGVDGGAADHPDVLARMGCTQLAEAPNDAEARP